jgi:broad specificity phosphatase PhoE
MTQRLFLLRHGEVTSHRGDVPVTEEGLKTAEEVGRRLADRAEGAIRVVSGETRRTRETASAVARGARAAGAEVLEDGVAFALRNPDLYLAGVRVDMVSSEAAFAAQVPGLEESDIGGIAFFSQWLTEPDRVGWWVAHQDPPGDDAAQVATRIKTYAASLADRTDSTAFTVAITHSPVLRAVTVDVTGADPGEPQWLAGLEAEISPDRAVALRVLTDAP